MVKFYLSLGNIIRAAMTIKNTNVCKKKPIVVGQPELGDATLKNGPNTICESIYVSGLATRKNTKAL